MHYDFKKKLNKIDSQQYKNLLVPEIDWVLNEAMNLFIDMVAEPRLRGYLGFETSQKNTEDIRTLVIVDQCSTIQNNNFGTGFPDKIKYSLPDDYLYYIKAFVFLDKGPCRDRKVTLSIQSQNDDFEESYFDKSSFEWKHVNGIFAGNDIILHTDTTFEIKRVCLSYIRKPKYMHNAEDFRNGTYKLPSGITLSGTQDCELPVQTRKEIVDLAVLITTGELQIPDYQIKAAKLNLNKLLN